MVFFFPLFFEEVKHIYVFILVLIEKSGLIRQNGKGLPLNRRCFETGEREEERKKKKRGNKFYRDESKRGREMY